MDFFADLIRVVVGFLIASAGIIVLWEIAERLGLVDSPEQRRIKENARSELWQHLEAEREEQNKVETERILRIKELMMVEPYQFEKEMAKMLCALGYEAKVTRASRDGGIDIIAKREKERMFIQCKRYTNQNVGVRDVRELAGVMLSEQVKFGMLITTTNFTEEAYVFANKAGIELINGGVLDSMMQKAQGQLEQDIIEVEGVEEKYEDAEKDDKISMQEFEKEYQQFISKGPEYEKWRWEKFKAEIQPNDEIRRSRIGNHSSGYGLFRNGERVSYLELVRFMVR